MSYKEYIQEALESYVTDNEYKISVVEEVDFNYNPDDNEIVVVYKELAGSVVGNVKFMNIQFNVFSSANEVNYTKEILNSFVADYSNTSVTLGLDHYKQDYNTPIDLTNFNEVGHTQRAMFLITGTLLVTSNISDIKRVRINNIDINYTNVNISYTAQPHSYLVSSENLMRHSATNPNLQINIVAYIQNDSFNTLISLLKTNQKGANDTYTIELTYVDGNRVETYTCSIYSLSENYDITNPPTRNVVFMLA